MKNSLGFESTIDWNSILLPLLAAANQITEKKQWFRGKETKSFLRGRTAEDYAMDAILKYLEHPEKYNPKKGTLLNYLILNVMRSLISNDLKSAENKKSLEDIQEEETEELSYNEYMQEYIGESLKEDLDPDKIIEEIKNEIKKEDILQEVMLCLQNYEHPRKAFDKVFNRDVSIYDNGIRRIKTIATKIMKKYQIRTLKL